MAWAGRVDVKSGSFRFDLIVMPTSTHPSKVGFWRRVLTSLALQFFKGRCCWLWTRVAARPKLKTQTPRPNLEHGEPRYEDASGDVVLSSRC